MTPSRIEELMVPVWLNGRVVTENLGSLLEAKQRAKSQLGFLRGDHKRNLNPTPYKVRSFQVIILLFTQLLDFKLLNSIDKRVARVVRFYSQSLA